ncbi:HNH endonuclease [Microvirga calopogonii]|uniref:HNH endonuclease n=1 Tax=Microvirga calopogonii TaxID=2078013 RepID=UPI000E0DC8FF|nr:HNH endonuclease signature motif containing protein [Microvirga calopogonii]
MSANKTEILNEYQAAVLTGLSPDLLRWLVSYAPKQGVDRKLKVARKENGAYLFERAEVEGFNDWLKAPWPHKSGQRPPIPAGIMAEIKREANGECAICRSNRDTCEAAHLDPVATSKNNHPENLLWLCSNHHTAYDKGLFGPDPENASFVRDFKQTLHRYKRMTWEMQADLSRKLFNVLDLCDRLSLALEGATTPVQVEAVEAVARDTLAKIPDLAPVSKMDPRYEAYKRIKPGMAFIADETQGSVEVRLLRAKAVRSEFVASFGFVACPLCDATGRHDGFDCPVCHGDREIDEHTAARVDLRDFEKVQCPLCHGSGSRNGMDCLVCGGEKQIEQRTANELDMRDFETVDCPVCEGSGRRGGMDCRACGGEGRMDRRDAGKIDVRDYQDVECPVCEGSGRHSGIDCSVCGGEGTIERVDLAKIDLADYQQADCPVCEGSGRHDGLDCPACGGEGQIERRYLDRIDVRDYQPVECPICSGSGRSDGGDCRACDGEGMIERRFAERLDHRDYGG